MNIAIKKSSIELSTVQRSRFIFTFAGSVAMGVGGLVLIGWLLGIRTLTSVTTDFNTMKPNTAFCFVLAGLSLWLLRLPANQAEAFTTKRDRTLGARPMRNTVDRCFQERAAECLLQI